MTEEQVLKRDCYFDNLKGVLIFIVVLGHFLSKMNNLDNYVRFKIKEQSKNYIEA